MCIITIEMIIHCYSKFVYLYQFLAYLCYLWYILIYFIQNNGLSKNGPLMQIKVFIGNICTPLGSHLCTVLLYQPYINTRKLFSYYG